jgi:hypothetical protein
MGAVYHGLMGKDRGEAGETKVKGFLKWNRMVPQVVRQGADMREGRARGPPDREAHYDHYRGYAGGASRGLGRRRARCSYDTTGPVLMDQWEMAPETGSQDYQTRALAEDRQCSRGFFAWWRLPVSTRSADHHDFAASRSPAVPVSLSPMKRSFPGADQRCMTGTMSVIYQLLSGAAVWTKLPPARGSFLHVLGVV